MANLFEIKPAQRTQLKVRVGFFGNSGSGKTNSSLEFAFGLTGDWSKICVIDTEYGRSEAYADKGPFSVLKLEAPFHPDRYIKAIEQAEKAGFEVIIIDSISHEWMGKGGILELGDRMGQSAAKWATLTPMHQKFIDKIQSTDAHILCCGRTKETIAMNKMTINGVEKTVVEKIPMKIQTRDGFEFEMLISFFLGEDHLVKVEKDNTGLFDGHTFMISQEHGRELMEWVLTGKKVTSKVELERIAEKEAEELAEKEAEELKKFFQGKIDQYTKEINGAKTEASLKKVTDKMKAEIAATEGKTANNIFGAEGFTGITKIVMAKKSEFNPKTDEKPVKKTLAQEIKDLEFGIEIDQSQYNIGNDHPTDTDQFRAAQSKLYTKIGEDRQKLSQLKALNNPQTDINQ